MELYRSGIEPEKAARDAGYKRLGAASALIEKLSRENSAISDGSAEVSRGGVADSTEVLEMLTSVMRGDVHDPVVVVEQRTGKEGKTERRARVINKSASVKERMNAAEMLARRYGIFNGDGGDDEGVVFVGEDRLLDDEESEFDEED